MFHDRTYTAHDGTRIWCATDGQGPTLVLCDGIGCDGYIWPYLLDHFDERFTFVRWHYRGHGRSEDPADPERVTMQDITDDLHGALHLLAAEQRIQLPAILVGHSMGVQVILEYAHRFPQDVRALVPLCGSPGRPLDTFKDSDTFKTVLQPLLNAVKRAPHLAQTLWNSALNPTLSWLVASRTEVDPKRVRRVDFLPYLKHMGRVRIETFLSMLNALSEHDARPYLPDIHHPTLVFAGERDSFTPMRLSEDLVALLPHARLVVLPEGTHTAPLELPDLINQELERFLEAHHLTTPPAP
jgi:pimeloyl-ACP methyl ester carboxylesterase